MIVGIGNEDMFILIKVEIFKLMKIVHLGKSHITYDKKGSGL